ncbi:major facilitator transporter [Chlorella sorokiniana]|uniref:Major facilitator transporter n=1 Tax=Chlorella sorokiniana TaxID=3076 RepID=A0A2P6TTV5_CHLSO|nr:major facilitator transporter [Chlorella sorokiniana]|eukprot:PRW57505.1 major facilitator transporter [Chlorella sorokiniana]
MFVCCDAPPGADRLGLLCSFNGSTVQATVQDGSVTCCPPATQELVSDAEQQGVRLRVTAAKAAAAEQEHAGGLHEEILDWAEFEARAAGTAVAAAMPPPPAKQGSRARVAAAYSALKPFIIISLSYLLFTITDGAVRMIVLLHAYQKGFSAMEVATMFSFYELAGVATNLAAGLMGAKWGIRYTLLSGLCLQLVGIGMLFGWQDGWSKTEAIVYVTAAQLMCGIAKDLTKLGGKTVTKLVTPEEKRSSLFKLVSFITGWKNSLKGAGYFLGAATVGVNYYMSLGILCGLILAAMPWAATGLSSQLGRARKENVSFAQLFRNKPNVNVLSLSRVFLFGARDLWFEVPLPFFLRSPDSGIGWSRSLTGAFLAIWIIVYGQFQSWTPQLVLGPLRQSPPNKWVAALYSGALAVLPLTLGIIMLAGGTFGPDLPAAPAVVAITVCLYGFCIVFAINSAIHSYLIVAYAEGDKVAQTVGVYYASNAVGRLVGTLASGALYSYVGSSIVDGFGACLMVSVAFAAASCAIDFWLHEEDAAPGVHRLGRLGACLPGRKQEAAAPVAQPPAAEATTP